ncbi:MAG: amidohydrolase family protein, partial [Pseudomonadota bacterium]
MTATLLLGQTLSFRACPFAEGPGAAVHEARGAIRIEGGRIVAAGARGTVPEAGAEAVDYGAALLLPGFVDAHAHYPQTRIIASWGKRLIDWLEGYTFPEEMRFGNAAYAAEVAELYLDLCLANGITTAASYCTIHPESASPRETCSPRA